MVLNNTIIAHTYIKTNLKQNLIKLKVNNELNFDIDYALHKHYVHSSNKWILKETMRYCVWCENPRIALLRSLTQVWCVYSYLLDNAVTSLPLFRSITDISPTGEKKERVASVTKIICSYLDPSLISSPQGWCQHGTKGIKAEF